MFPRQIIKAIDRAYRTMEERHWDTIYWAVDLHGVCLKSNYKTGGYDWINEESVAGMRAISRRPESKIILWSSVHPREYKAIVDYMAAHQIWVQGFNENQFEKNNAVSCFDSKFYFSVLLDDKAGFDPDVDWIYIKEYLNRKIV